MVISSPIRRNKKFVKETESIELVKPQNIDKIRQFLSDGNWHSMRQIFAGTGLTSAGNMARNMDRLLNAGEVETGTCDHCDSVTTLYRLVM